MITLLITILFFLFLAVCLFYCLRQASVIVTCIPAPIVNIAVVIVFIVILAFFLNYMGYGPSLGIK